MTLAEDIQLFKERKIKAKSIFEIKEVSKKIAYDFVKQYHYLKDAKFFSTQAFGLFYKATNELVGVATFAPPYRSWYFKRMV